MKQTCSSKIWIIAVIIIAIVVAGIGVYFLYPRHYTENVALTQLTFSNSDYDPDWSPDGNKIVFVRVSGQGQKLCIINTDGSGLSEIGFGGDPSWSPVEDKIAYTLNGNIYTMNSHGGSIMQLTNDGAGNPSWNSDGTKIVYTHYQPGAPSIWTMNADGSGKIPLTTFENDGECSWPSFSYDGLKIVYIKGPAEMGLESHEPNEIWVMDNDGRNKHLIYASNDSYQWIFQRAWNKNNKILFMRCWIPESPPDVWVIDSDGSGASAVIESKQYTYGDPVWNNAGDKVAIIMGTSQTSQNIFIFSYK